MFESPYSTQIHVVQYLIKTKINQFDGCPIFPQSTLINFIST